MYSINRETKGAHSFDTATLSTAVDAMRRFSGSEVTLRASFSNGHDSEFTSVEDLNASRLASSWYIKRLNLSTAGERGVVRATLTLRPSVILEGIDCSIMGEAAPALLLEDELRGVTNRAERWFSAFYALPDVFLYVPAFAIAYAAYVATPWLFPGFELGSNAFWGGGFGLTVVLFVVRALLFPRLEFNFGRGARRYGVRAWVRKFLFVTVIGGTLLAAGRKLIGI